LHGFFRLLARKEKSVMMRVAVLGAAILVLLPVGSGQARAAMLIVTTQAAASKTDAQRIIKGRALDLTTEIAQTRLRLAALKDSSITVPFLMVLVSWLVVLFAGYGLMAPQNATVIVPRRSGLRGRRTGTPRPRRGTATPFPARPFRKKDRRLDGRRRQGSNAP
jgi:hypothetical protein